MGEAVRSAASPSYSREGTTTAAFGPDADLLGDRSDVCFSNRPFEVKRSQTIRHSNVDVAHGLALLFGIGTRALPSWDTRTR